MSEEDFKVGDICYVVEDDETWYDDRLKYLNCVGKVDTTEYYINLIFPDGIGHAYHPYEVRLATQDEEDRFHLMRYKYV